MPESVRLGDRYWLMQQVHELPAGKERSARGFITQMDAAYRRGDEDELYEWAKPLIRLTCVDDVDTESVDVLEVPELGDLVNAVSDDPYTFPTA